jgi:hypothetical protein
LPAHGVLVGDRQAAVSRGQVPRPEVKRGALVVVALATLGGLAACRDRTQSVDVPIATGTGAPITSAPKPPPSAQPKLARVERSFTSAKLPSTDVTPDVFLRGAVNPAFRAALDAATRSLVRRGGPVAGPEGRFFVPGEDAQGNAKFVLFAADGSALGTDLGEDVFFGATGALVFHRGPRMWTWDGRAPPRALGADQPKLCGARTCKPRTVPIALSADEKTVLVALARGGFVGDDESFALDLATGAATTVLARSNDVAYLSGTRSNDGTFCAFKTPVSHAAEPGGPSAPGVLLCFPPPWSAGRALLETSGGAWVALGGVGSKLVTGDVSALHVVDPRTGDDRAYATPEGGGLLVPLRDGRSVAVEGDDRILLVDVVAETYAVYATSQTIVLPLGEGVKGFIATGDGKATLVRFE